MKKKIYVASKYMKEKNGMLLRINILSVCAGMLMIAVSKLKNESIFMWR